MFDVWEHHYNFLLPLLVLAWIRGRSKDKARWVPLILVLMMSIPMLPITEYLSGIDPVLHPINMEPIWLIVYHSSKALPALIFYVWLFVMAFRLPRYERFEESAQETYLLVWKNLISGSYPRIEDGIIVHNEQESIKNS
jgi:hypothetical protein